MEYATGDCIGVIPYQWATGSEIETGTELGALSMRDMDSSCVGHPGNVGEGASHCYISPKKQRGTFKRYGRCANAQ